MGRGEWKDSEERVVHHRLAHASDGLVDTSAREQRILVMCLN